MRSRNAKPERPRRFSYEGLERVIHERARLSILASLLAYPQGLTFTDLLDLCDLTDGNLSRHLQILQTAKLVTVSRGTGPGRPQTVCRITALGRRRFLGYLAVLERVLCDAAAALDPDSGPHPSPVSARS
jgi:DNA-binding transcriptional ArsR family regulator